MAQPNWYRKCVGCGTARHKKELLRIVLNIDNQLQIDLKQTEPGRGTYLCPKQTCAKSAQQNHGIEKSLKCEVNTSFYQYLIQLAKKIEHN